MAPPSVSYGLLAILSGHEGLKQGKEEGEYCHPMTPEGLFTVALGLGEGWSVNQCSFEGTPPELLLKLDFKAGHRFGCPECGANSPTHDTGVKRWRHLDFFQCRCELEARVPRVDCQEHGVRLIDVPLGRAGSRFTLHLGVGEWVKQRSDIRWCKTFLLPFSLQEVFTERKEKPKPLAIP